MHARIGHPEARQAALTRTEHFAFAAKGGADLANLRTALMGGFGDSKVLNLHGARMAAPVGQSSITAGCR